MSEREGNEIRRLDQRTVEQIAAGEVVERPASAVKELVENSIDAEADRVTVAVTGDGTDLLRVTDDGIGMDESTLRRAVEKHTTSKITGIEDLESGVGTLGFRGEALHAIGAVSRLTIASRPPDGRGTELTVEGGEITDVSPTGCPTGTTVTVRDLFYNVPARRKYLSQPTTEFSHVNRIVTNYALANPDVAVTLEHDDSETFATTGSGELRETVMSVYGREVATAMIDLAPAVDTEGPLESVSGLVSHPETNRASSEYVSTFVNGRYVEASAVQEAILEAYDTQLAPDRFPFATVFLQVDPATIDVNVHPRKRELRFAEESAVRKQVRAVVEDSLLEAGVLRSSAPRGRSAPEETDVAPATDSGESASIRRESPDQTTAPDDGPADADQTPIGDTASDEGALETSAGTDREPTQTTTTERSAASKSSAATDDPAESSGTSATDSPGHDRHEQFRQDRLGEARSGSTGEYDTLPTLRVLGQLDETYVVAASEDGLVLVDQHAADERINYERLQAARDGETTTQALADPVRVSVTPAEAERLAAHQDALARLGVRAARADDQTVEVRALPGPAVETAGPELVRDLLTALADGPAAAERTVEAVADELLADLACYPSITGNTSLTEGSIVDLLDALDDCENPWACPHGRPVLIEIDDTEIEARFERDYPGHSD